MKKTFKYITYVGLMLISMLILSACSGRIDISYNNQPKSTDAQFNNSNVVDGNLDGDTSQQKLNLKDKELYYFSINGEKYTTDNQLKDITKSGFNQDINVASAEIQKGSYSIGNGFFRDATTGKSIFSVIPINNTNETVKCEDATIGGLFLENYYYKEYGGKIEIYGGITIGSTLEQLVGVFGEPTEKDMRENYDNLGIVYKYKAGLFQYFEFEIDKKTNCITSISWRYLKNEGASI